MKNSWFSFLVVLGLLGLLGLLAALQYKWLGQISDADRVRLEKRLKEDTKRFAESFNRELSNLHAPFQMDSKSWSEFNSRYQLWRKRAKYPESIKEFYFVKKEEDELPLYFDKEKQVFVETKWTKELERIRSFYKENQEIDLITPEEIDLIVPVYKTQGGHRQIIVREREFKSGKITRKLKLPDTIGFLIIRLNGEVLKNKILQDLSDKYFSDSYNEKYNLIITDKNNDTIYERLESPITKSDADAKLFSVNQENIWVFEEKDVTLKKRTRQQNKIVLDEVVEREAESEFKGNKSDEVVRETVRAEDTEDMLHDERKRNGSDISSGLWKLSVQHSAGSLDQFIENTRRRNLAISFSILALLAVSIVLIFLSSQRAKILAQRQIDFVSSVSHEFRTPISVIYSAGENLSDGVIGDREKISSYGTLIKREGKKLSSMVEQILEFAGAKSGNRKYDFRTLEIGKVIGNVLLEFEPLISEHGIEIETEIENDLLKVLGDKKALEQVIQNLLNNSVKYSNGSKWIKISAENNDEKVKIAVEDKGVGISTKDRKHIFEPFYRAESVVDEQISGSGLGLSLVKQIVDAHGGTIEVKSEVSKGSKFTVNLPVKI